MENAISALMGVLLFTVGIYIGTRLRSQPAQPEEAEETTSRDLRISALDTKKERRKKLDAQLENLFTYSGENQV